MHMHLNNRRDRRSRLSAYHNPAQTLHIVGTGIPDGPPILIQQFRRGRRPRRPANLPLEGGGPLVVEGVSQSGNLQHSIIVGADVLDSPASLV